MDSATQDPRGFWGSRWTFTLAAVGCALGLGNLWRWPVLFDSYGGGAFLAVYLLFLVLIALPLLMAEFMLGRQYRQNPVGAMVAACRQSRISGYWPWLARGAILAGFLIFSFYVVVGGMALAYVGKSAVGVFDGATPDAVTRVFGRLRGDAGAMVMWQTLFLALVMIVSIRGIHQGLARSIRVVVPLMLLLLLALLAFASRVGDVGAVTGSLTTFSWGSLGVMGVLEAMAQAFFTVGVATGAMIMLGAYMPGQGSVRLSAMVVVLVDTLVAIAAALFVFSLLRPLGMDAEPGFGVLFNSLPLAISESFREVALSSQPVTSMLFVLTALIAWSSAVIVIEPVVSWLSEVTGGTRMFVVTVVMIMAWLVGLGTILSLNVWEGATVLGHTLFGWLNLLASGVLMPVAGIALALLLGWVRPAWLNRQGLVLGEYSFLAWQIMMRWVVPALLLVVMLFSLGRFWMAGCEQEALPFCRGAQEHQSELPDREYPLLDPQGSVERPNDEPDTDE